ncbi:MAG: tRNA (N6-isopentenyl adenosine(37)-C2)-methylthiotransferase MiaB [Firmicutes bacterium HGW-Firmicutes-11]|nr:MAG: tRNA (N6-isopentenyl adenosine(37)-C2)-methylthiotransferase MiaB [Firmicutes bacterium HGW-Firmicutes-11]
MKQTFHITTFGCQMNEHDSETIAGMLSGLDYTPSASRNDADVIIINTCSVRENADHRFFGTLGQLKRIRKERPDLIVAVCGCMMQQQHVIDKLKSQYPWVDLIFGTHTIHRFPELLQNVRQERVKLVDVMEDSEEIVEGLPVRRNHPNKAYVNIMYGCNNFCTYCIVPYTRGRERSRDTEEILREVKELVKDGVKEITLLGQNVNSYRGTGRQGQRIEFADLITELDRIHGLSRIRFMTSHPKDLSDALILAYRNCPSLCPHIHLPVQSGSTSVLERMNRKYNREDYIALVERLRSVCPDIAITTDIIVGFPGETEEEFQDTLRLVEEIEFDSAFTFLYSIRKGTPAETFEDQVPEEIKHERFNRLVETVNRISAKKNATKVGCVEDVLVEGASKSNDRVYTGRTGGFKLVNFKGPEGSKGTVVSVRITDSNTFSLTGVVECDE